MKYHLLTKWAPIVATTWMLFALGCGSSGGSSNACNGVASRCDGNNYQVCENGNFVTAQACSGQCIEDVGCGECNPVNQTTCSGNDVVRCNADGSIGSRVASCIGGLICSAGDCADTATCTNVIYVVDTSENLVSFDPSRIGTGTSPFTLIANLDCPDVAESATPFSMAVDRSGMAWILYNSGQLYKTPVDNVACVAAGVESIDGFHRFAMSFAIDEGGDGEDETLWIAGDLEGGGCCGDLGYIRDNTMANVNAITATSTSSPELAGTRNGELYAFFPHTGAAFVQRINKADGSLIGDKFLIGDFGFGAVTAFAFAQWGGKFYIFVSQEAVGQFLGTFVGELDPTTRSYRVVIEDAPYKVVGADSSACATE